jgi:hypothetical protein
MDADLAKRLADIGPYVVEIDADAQFVVRWEALPELTSPVGLFGLEFGAEAMGLIGRQSPDLRVFKLWELWKSRHASIVEEMRTAVELELEAAGAVGSTADFVRSARVTVSQLQDGPNCRYYTLEARVTLTLDPERIVVATLDPDSGEVGFE